MPAALKHLHRGSNLQTKHIKTNFDELRLLDVPAILSVRDGRLTHAAALVGIGEGEVLVGEPLKGLIKVSHEDYIRRWHWDGHATVIAPDFRHGFRPHDQNPRALELFDALESVGYTPDERGIKQFQADNGLKERGYLDWRTILIVDKLTASEARPRLSSYFADCSE